MPVSLNIQVMEVPCSGADRLQQDIHPLSNHLTPSTHMKLRLYPDPILTQVSDPAVEGQSYADLFNEMETTMHNEGGIGLAAVQIGVLVRAIVVGNHRVLNPRIVSRSGISNPTDERCLSVVGITRRRDRSYSVKVVGFDEHWKRVCIESKGKDAAVFQHEIDHCNGRTIADA